MSNLNRLPAALADSAVFGASAARARAEALAARAHENRIFRFALVCVSIFAVACGAIAGVAFR